jgi:hypothetical protein
MRTKNRIQPIIRVTLAEVPSNQAWQRAHDCAKAIKQLVKERRLDEDSIEKKAAVFFCRWDRAVQLGHGDSCVFRMDGAGRVVLDMVWEKSNVGDFLNSHGRVNKWLADQGLTPHEARKIRPDSPEAKALAKRTGLPLEFVNELVELYQSSWTSHLNKGKPS